MVDLSFELKIKSLNMKDLIPPPSNTDALQKHLNELESKCKILQSDLENCATPFKLSIQFREIGVPIIEIVNNALLADNKHTIKKMTIMVANRINAPFIDIMCDYGNGFKSTIVHNQTYFDSLDKVSEHGLLVIKICPTDFGLEKSVDVTLIIY